MNEYLAHIQQDWNNTPVSDSSRFDCEELPVGRYDGTIEEAAVKQTDTGKALLKYIIKTFIDGREALTEKVNYVSAASIGIIKNDFSALGFNTDAMRIEYMEEYAKTAIGAVVRIRVTEAKQSKEPNARRRPNNIFFAKLLQPSGQPEFVPPKRRIDEAYSKPAFSANTDAFAETSEEKMPWD